MYNLKAAVSRLEFAPKPDDLEVTDIASGHFVFSPVLGNEVHYDILHRAITDAGYEIEQAFLTVQGVLSEERHLRTPNESSYRLQPGSEDLRSQLASLEPDHPIEIEGAWTLDGESEVIVVSAVRRLDSNSLETPDQEKSP